MTTNSQKANVLKGDGNTLFAKGNFADALAKYNQAIALDPLQVVYHSNASQCLLNLKRYQDALDYADKALALDPNHVKSLVRRSNAFRGLSRVQDALMDLQHASKLEPNNKSIISELTLLMESVNIESKNSKQNPSSSSQSSSTTPTPKFTSSALKEASVALKNTASEVPQPASTFGEFEVHWRSLLAHPEDLHSYLRSISPGKIASIFKDLMTADMLYSWLNTVSQLFDLTDAPSHAHAAEILESLCNLPRFSLLRIFLSETQVELIKLVLSKMALIPDLKEAYQRIQPKFM